MRKGHLYVKLLVNPGGKRGLKLAKTQRLLRAPYTPLPG